MKGRNFVLGTNSLEGRDSHLTSKTWRISLNFYFSVIFDIFLQPVQRSFETTYYTVSDQCSCHPADSGFTRDLALPHRCWCRSHPSGTWLHINLIESTNISGKQSDILSPTEKKLGGNITYYDNYQLNSTPECNSWLLTGMVGVVHTHTHTHTHTPETCG
jgi:hypothetical protein